MPRAHPLILLAVILAAAAFPSAAPSPPNFTPIGAMALFSGAHFRDRGYSFVAPLAAMFLGDLVIELHPLIPAVYGSFVLVVTIGFWLRSRKNVLTIAEAVLASSVLFFLVTNFAVWAFTPTVSKTIAALLAAYVAAIPFFQNTVAGICSTRRSSLQDSRCSSEPS